MLSEGLVGLFACLFVVQLSKEASVMHTASKKGLALEPAAALLQVEPLHVPISITRPTGGGSGGKPSIPAGAGACCA